MVYKINKFCHLEFTKLALNSLNNIIATLLCCFTITPHLHTSWALP